MRIGIGTSIVGQQIVGGVQYLDEVGGTPTAAYSVDKVVSTYTDAVVEVRRTVSAVTVEADVAFDGDTITLDSAVTITSGSSSATTLGEFVAASGYTDVDSLGSPQDAFVATWYDQAGSNDATQTTASDQPKIVSAGALVTENGKVALNFDGVNDYFTASFSSSQPIFVSLVVKNVKAGVQFPYYFDSNNSNRFLLYVENTNGITASANYVDPNVLRSTITKTVQSLISVSYNTASSFLAIDGNIAVSGTIESNSIVAPLYIGARNNQSQQMTGTYQELIIYNSDKSALRTAIEGNINGRFSIYA